MCLKSWARTQMQDCDMFFPLPHTPWVQQTMKNVKLTLIWWCGLWVWHPRFWELPPSTHPMALGKSLNLGSILCRVGLRCLSVPWAQPGCYAGPELKQEGVGGVWIFQALHHPPSWCTRPIAAAGWGNRKWEQREYPGSPPKPTPSTGSGSGGAGGGSSMFAGEEGASLHEPGMLGSGIHHGCATVAARAHLLRSFT